MAVQTVHQIFEEQAERSTALICGTRYLSYGQINRMADSFAHVLQRRGARPGTLVGLFGERSVELVVGLLAILKSGAGYVPIDSAYPPQRISQMIEDARLALVVNTPTTGGVHSNGVERVFVPIEEPDLTKTSAPVQSQVTAEDTAAVLYTSGTEGRPKGVVIPHRAIISRRDDLRDYLAETTTCLWRSSISTVGHVSNLLLPLMTGRKVVVATEEISGSPRKLAEAITRHNIGRVALVPSLLSALLDCEAFLQAETLRTIVLSGEAVTPRLLRTSKSRMPRVAFINAYGTTETTGLVSRAEVTDPERIVVSTTGLGANMCILDSAMKEVPPGTPGELCVTGPQLAAGYLHDTPLTSERFVPFSLGDRSGTMYRTGDIARCTHDGSLEILGRIDQQVKVRGFRFNLADVESVLESHEAVDRAVVVLENGFPHAYLQATNAIFSEIRSHVNVRLPSFMIPRSFTVVREFPLLPNGKTDRFAVANGLHRNEIAGGQTTVPAGTATEAAVSRIWEEVFQVPSIVPSDSFFDFGGDSLHSLQILAKIEAQWDVELTPEQLFGNPTVGALARLIDSADSNDN